MNALVTLKKYNLECCHVIQDFQMIITHIINVGNNEMMEDCLSLATTEAKKEQVYIQCSESYIKQRDYDRAFNLWSSLPKKTCISVLQRIVYNVHAASLIQGFENTDISYINNLKLLEMHLAEVLKDSDEGEYIIEEIPMKKLKGDYFVKKYVDSESVVDDVWQNASQLNKSLSRFASQSYANMSASDLLLQLKKLSEILDCGVEDILINMLINFNEEDDDALSMTLITKLLLSVQGEGEVHMAGRLLDWILSSLVSSSLKEDCARNIQEYLRRNLTVCNPRDRPFYLELCRFLKLWFPHFGAGRIHGTDITAHLLPRQCRSMQASHGGIPPHDLLLSAIILRMHRHYWFSLFLQVHTHQGFKEATGMSLAFSDSLREFIKNGSSWVSHQAVCIIAWCKALWSDDIDFMSISPCNLLSRLTFHKDMNVAVMIGLISGHKKSMIIDWLNTCINKSQGDLFKTWTLASMGEILCDLYDMDKLAYSYADMSWRCIVAKRLKEMGMISGGTDGESLRISEDMLLRRVMSQKYISVADVEEICFLCHLDTEKMLLKYMEHLLLTWTPKYSVKALLNGHEEIVILNNVDEIDKVICFIRPLIIPEKLSIYLHSLWEKVSIA
ncbi:uncharacterized protein [Hetaerina americana]|uniref:uncharacterized protein n=1 Tax=Hetaerina americana TaxID=62018 RepID=UPI003A7F2BBE